MPARTDSRQLRVPTRVYTTLREVSAIEKRTMSSQLEIIMEEGLKALGYKVDLSKSA